MATDEAGGGDKFDIKALCDEVTKNADEAVKAGAALPKLGTDYELYNVDNKFMKVNQNCQKKIFSMLSCVLNANNYLLSGQTRMSDMSELVNANDYFLQKASMAIERHENEKNGESNVIIRCADGQLRKPTEAYGNDGAGKYAHLSSTFKKVDQNMVVTKPQKAFQDAINNSSRPFVPRLPVKHNSLDFHPDVKMEILDSEHPYNREIVELQVLPDTFSKSVQDMKELNRTPLVMVDTEDGLKELVSTLKKTKEFAVDVEHNSYRSFLGLTCLIQISTRSSDYIVDPFPIWRSMHLLNDPFSDPKILKVFHGAEKDIIWLQRDFGIYVVNMVDTFVFMKALKLPKKSYQHLVFSSFGIMLDKKLQKSDWRQRPLDNEHLQYARCDTHFLLPAYDKLCKKLSEMDDFDDLSNSIFEKSKQVCLNVFEQPLFDENGYKSLAVKELNNRQLYVLKHLWEWRDSVGREEDESLEFILPNHMLLHIAEVLPREIQGILACCAPVPVMVKRDIFVIHRFVTAARDLPLEEKEQYESALSFQETVRNKNLVKNRYTKEIARLDSRFDQREYKVEDERPDRAERLSIIFHNQPVGHTETSKTQPLLPFKKVGITVAQKVKHKLEEIRQKFEQWNSPYSKYLLTLEEKRKTKTEEQEEAPTNQFSHHCPAPPRTSQVTEVKSEVVDVDPVAPTASYYRKKKHTKPAMDNYPAKKPKVA
ncbi:unnamed protein product [Bursaphelenchus okinawaensis]|uniref:HRDC domain-containing protein n=1 Tax=Bursaphelenchus okinawaensis TaxID=465554 RepID=A0A811K853_9BILA|nr:unnamed protein product [Bursaphelenchus okinawaensis]CAG9095306.1 unnamed protein product [Bursaphelenchus okinawaensis]